MEQRIIFIEPQPDLESIVKEGKLDRSRVFIPSKEYQKRLENVLNEFDKKNGVEFIDYNTVDADYDDWLYGNSYKIAEAFVNFIKSSSYLLTKDKQAILREEAERALKITLHDRLVTLIRPYNAFINHCVENDVKQVDFVARGGSNLKPIEELFKFFGLDTNFHISHLNAKAQNYIRKVSSDSKYNIKAELFTLPPLVKANKLPILKNNQLTVVANLKDNQYKYTVLPLIKELIDSFYINCIGVYEPMDDSYIDEFQLSDKLRKRYFQSSKCNSTRERASLAELNGSAKNIVDSSIRRLSTYVSSNDKEILPYSSLISNYLSIYSPAILIYLERFRKEVLKSIYRSKAVLVIPGRYIESIISVEIAKKIGLKTFELQSGTISKSKRFITPSAEKIFCIDPFSKEVYTKFLGKSESSVIPVGSPKIDYSLSKVKNISQSVAFRRVFEGKEVLNKKITILIATQPVGKTLMGKLLLCLFEALNSEKDVRIILKMHPNEGDEYSREYLAIKNQFPDLEFLIIDKDKSIYDCVQLSDIVCTYYSTVGLEAFCLGKKVISINSTSEAPPFDLVALKVAESAHGPEDIKEIFKMFLEERNLERNDHLNYLKDGKSSERINRLINLEISENIPLKIKKFINYLKIRK